MFSVVFGLHSETQTSGTLGDSKGALPDGDKNEQKKYLLIWALLCKVPEREHNLGLRKKKVLPAEDSAPYFTNYDILIIVKGKKYCRWKMIQQRFLLS